MRKKQPTPYWATELLNRFSPGELQAGTKITRHTRHKDGSVTTKTTRNKGTRIPASTWARMQSGEISPGTRTLEKLARFKARTQYNILRAAGESQFESARKRKMESFAEVEKIAEVIADTAASLAKALSKLQNRELKAEWLQAVMANSERTIEDWEAYISLIS